MIKGTVTAIEFEERTGVSKITIISTVDEIKKEKENPLFRIVNVILQYPPIPDLNKQKIKPFKIGISHKKFPSLSRCEKVIRKSIADHRLTSQDKHVIGTLWAYLERVHNET